MVTPYVPWEIKLNVVTTLITQGVQIGIVIVFSTALLGFVINKLIKLGMGNL